MRLRLVDLETGQVRSFDQLEGFEIDLEDWDPTTRGIVQSEFAPGGTLYTAGHGGVRR